jgi:subtilisin family serine protease
MLKRLCVIGVLAVASLSVGAAQGAPSATQTYIVVLRDGVDSAAVAKDHAKRFGVQVQFVYSSALRGYAGIVDTATAAAIGADTRVRFMQPDDPFSPPPDPRPPHASPKAPQPDQLVSNGLNRVDAELSSTASGDGHGTVNVNVAVLDTGIEWKHPDLFVAGGINCMPGERTTDYFDRHGHGTAVGGFIGALDNAIGRVGVAPGVRLFAARVLDSEANGTRASLLCGIDWVASTRTNATKTDDIQVANMSLAGPDPDDGNCGLSNHDAAHLAICNASRLGVTFVAAASNDGVDFVGTQPANYDEVLTATAVADYDGQPGSLAPADCGGFDDSIAGDDSAASFSDFATSGADRAHTVAAPGVCLGSTFLDSSYAIFFGGTSFAAPIVSGVVALCIASGPCAGLTPPQIIQKIVADAAAYNSVHLAYGFLGDPQHPIAGEYYGNLIRAAQY